MNLIEVFVSFLPSWVSRLIHKIPADQVGSQPDHQVTKDQEIKPETRPEFSCNQTRRLNKVSDNSREVNIELHSDLNCQEEQHQQELASLQRQQSLLECKITTLLASKYEESQNVEKLVSHRQVLQKENDGLRSELISKNQRYQNEVERLMQHRAVLEEKNTKLLALKDAQLEKMRNFLSHRHDIAKENNRLSSELNGLKQEYEKKLENQKQCQVKLAEEKEKLLAFKDSQLQKTERLLAVEQNVSKNLKEELGQKEKVLAFKNSELESKERLLLDQENLSRNLKKELDEVRRSNEELAEKFLMKEAESLSQNNLVEQLKEELNKALNSKEKLADELFKKEAEYVKSSEDKDKKIKELEIAISVIKTHANVEEKVFDENPNSITGEDGSCRVLDQHTLSQLRNTVAFTEIRENLVNLEVFHDSCNLQSSTIEENVKLTTHSFGQLLPQKQQCPQRQVYDRDTLMRLKNGAPSFGETFREHLLDLDVLRESSSLKVSPTNESVKPANQSFGQLSSEKKQDHQPKREVTLIKLQDKPSTPDNPNVRKPKRASLKTEENVTSTEETLTTVRGILKKLTPSNYTKLLQQIQEVNIDDQACLAAVIQIFFQKAVDEPIYSPTYAKMCLALSNKNVVSASNPAETISFRKLLLSHCKKEFEKDNVDREHVESKRREVERVENEGKRKQLQEESKELVDKNRRVALGNISFIGELFKISMITFKVMHQCIRKLLSRHDDEDSLECLCKLLTTVGKEIETPPVAEQAAKAKRIQFMNSVIQRLESIIEARKTCNRIRFMMQNVVELRQRAWKPRRA